VKLPPAQPSCLVLGALLVAGGVAWIFPPAGLIVAGVVLLLLGWPA